MANAKMHALGEGGVRAVTIAAGGAGHWARESTHLLHRHPGEEESPAMRA